MIRVLAICKNSIFIKGIQPHLYTHNIEIVGTCNNSAYGYREYQRLNPDIVLMGANWTGNFYTVSGADLVVQLKGVNEDAKIIAITNIMEQELLESLKSLNINGYVYRTMNDALSKIVNCIKIVYKGEKCFPN